MVSVHNSSFTLRLNEIFPSSIINGYQRGSVPNPHAQRLIKLIDNYTDIFFRAA